MSSVPDGAGERATSHHPDQPGALNDTCDDDPITMGVPRLLVEDARAEEGPGSHSESEPEPEPTLVAQPRPSTKDVGNGAQDRMGKGNDGIVARPRSRAPSEPLFFPDSDEEEHDATRRVDKGKQKEDAGPERNGDKSPSSLQAGHSATIAASSAAMSTSTSMAPLVHIGRSSTSIPDKPRSVQTVLSTRGAAWNLRTDRGRSAEDERERKRARLSSEGGVREKKKSFRSSLSQFLSTGRKALPDEKESESESGSDENRAHGIRKGEDRREVDERDEGDEGESEKHSGRGRKKRRRAGSDSSQVTVIVPSDDERAMDVDEPTSTVTKPAAVPSITPTSEGDVADRTEDVETLSGDDWAFSSTLVGTYIPPAGKTVEPSSESRSTRPATETDTDFVTLRVNLVSIGSYFLEVYNHLSSSPDFPSAPPMSTPSSTLRSAVSSANLETAAEDTVASAALSRIISKADFEHMVVVGQFNLGFIIVRKRCDAADSGRGGGGGAMMDDLFIVDQHAADEKWNFETLQEKTVIASQKLFRCVFLSSAEAVF